ncbi:GNAT family N-acetyltransferase [Streptococcus infantis]|uniref:GNAT family N-acetyltransferase n=1 Tax=Streptococcus infantis TaxID=68892 RepID=UPI0039C49844
MEFPIKIREAQQSDINQICLIQESISNSLEILNREIIEERIRKHAGTFLLASLNEEIIGYIIGDELTKFTQSDSRKQLEAAIPDTNDFITILDLAVHPDYQGQGFGTLLLGAMKEYTFQKNSQGLYLLSRDELLAYFEMNGFLDRGLADVPTSSETYFHMFWANPYFQEER